jgi:hypothetical protein
MQQVCKHCGVPVVLMEYGSGERLWHHAPVVAVHDRVGLIGDVSRAYFYCSSRAAA